MNPRLAAQIQTNLKDGKRVADILRDNPDLQPEDVAHLADRYVDSLFAMNTLIAQARPWKSNSWEAILGKFSLISLLLWVGKRDRHGPLKAGAAIVVWSLIDSGLREIQRRM